MRRRSRTVKKFSKKMQKKLIWLFLFITLALVGLICRLMYIEYTSGDKYKKIVLSQQEYDSRIIPYQRGDIVDTRGTVLATSIDVYNVILDCKVLNQKEKDIDATIDALVTCFPDLESSKLYQILKDSPKSQYVVLARKLPYDTIQPFVKMQTDSKKYPNVNRDAVWFEKEYLRTYPYNSLAASVIGFVSGGNVGTVGLENYYNSTLNGINGREYGYLNSDNNFEKTVKAPKDGNTIVSTIDMNIQSVVEEKMKAFNEEHRGEVREGDGSIHTAALIMNPQNGDVLAMANYPTFDLNNPRDINAYYSEKELEGKTDEEKKKLMNDLWQNFCVTYTFEPGSTAKPFTIAAGLETGTLSGNETYLCDGKETFNGQDVHCVSRMGHGIETIEKSLMDSCNDALMQMSYAIGAENFSTYQKIFGFGQKTNIDLPGEPQTQGLLFPAEQMKPIDLATNAFGQNFNCTMIQLASGFSSLINGGTYYQPHVVKKILDSEGNTIDTVKPVALKNTVSKETSDMLKQYLFKTVSDGTGHTAKVNGYSMGGKTGTAQKIPRKDRNYLVSFIGYAPQENPELLIYVVVDQPNVAEQAHSTYAQEIAKSILQEVLPYRNIYPDEELTEEDTEGETDNVNIPKPTQSSDVGRQTGDTPPADGEEGTQPNPDGEDGAQPNPDGEEGTQPNPDGGEGEPQSPEDGEAPPDDYPEDMPSDADEPAEQ